MTHVDSIWVGTLEGHIDSFTCCIDSLQAKLCVFQMKADLTYELMETSNDSISNQLSAASWLLGLIALLLSLGGIILGYYISQKKREIESIAKTISDTKEAVSKMAKATEALDEKIHKNLSSLYKDLRKEETNTLLDRLVEEPRDVSNLADVLLARDIEGIEYDKIKKAYHKLHQEVGGALSLADYELAYLILLFQHFFYQTLMDDEMRQLIIEKIELVFAGAFKRDMVKSTKELCNVLSDDSITFNKEDILVIYLKALNVSKFKEDAELKNILQQNIVLPNLLQKSIDRCKEEGVYLQMFGINAQENDANDSNG